MTPSRALAQWLCRSVVGASWGQPRLVPRSRLSFGLAEEPRSGKATQWLAGGQPLARLDSFSACEIERRPRGIARSLLRLFRANMPGDLRANPLAHASISRRMNQAVARALTGLTGPKQT